MTQNKRIVLNTVSTYGRSLFGVLCGIFSARWVLEALGQVDFGLYAVVGGMVVFLSFFNIQLAGAISRYYAYSIGQARALDSRDVGLESCRAWFTTAVMIHTVVPFVLVALGWPIGIYALCHGWISVPLERLNACLWVWRIVCVSSFFGMISVPFQAMYTAKQYIAELTIYSFFQTIIRTSFIYYMTTNPRDWLVLYALAMGIIVIAPQVAICIRAYFVFDECRIIPKVFKEFNRVKQVASYAIWTAIGGIGYMASHQCMGILLNNFYGARIAGAFGVSQTMSSEASSLTGALQSAFQPAITTTYGAGDAVTMRIMAFRVCKVGTILTLMFAIPMALEIDELLHLWLKEPPPYSESLSLCALAFIVIEKLTSGHIIAVNASGKIAKFQMVRGALRTLVIPLAIIPAYVGWGPVAATVALPLSVLLVDLGDVYLARSRVGMSFHLWIKDVVIPVTLLILLEFLVGYIPHFILPASLVRIVFTSMVVLGSMIPLVWFIVLSANERMAIKQRLVAHFTR